MKFLGFDPGAQLTLALPGGGITVALVEVTIERTENGRLWLVGLDEDGKPAVSLDLRADFFDALIVARTREAAA